MSAVDSMQWTPRDRILGFVDYLRSQGFSIGVGESTDILGVISASNNLHSGVAKFTLRALCCRNHDEWQNFEQHYTGYWYPDKLPPEVPGLLARIDSRQRYSAMAGMAGTSSQSMAADAGDDGYVDKGSEGRGAGRQRTIGKADFRFLGDTAAMREAGKLAEQLGLQLRKSLSRRREVASSGGQLDIRRTLRRSIATGGYPAHLQFSKRKLAPLHLVILHDVSHSMTWNNPLLFRFARGLIKTFNNSVAYGFHTRLFPVTRFLRESSLQRMRSRLEQQNDLWLGGTCIARSIQEFNKQYRAKDVTNRSIVLIISDGFDTDDRSMLERELTILRTGAKKLLWLNPMLGRPGVTLDVAELHRSLPLVDRFMPANSVDGLRATIREIASCA